MKESTASIRCGSRVPPVLQSAKLVGRVRNLVAHMAIEHRYRNVSDEELEIQYTFPIPAEAVLTEISLTLNGKSLKGIVKPKKSAEKDYEEAIEDGDSAVLVERAGPGLFTATLGNLLPTEEATLRYEWVMPMQSREGRAQLSIPTSIKNRYGNPQIDGKLKPHQIPQQNALVEYPFTVQIDFDAHAAKARISAPEHDAAEVHTIQEGGETKKRLLINDDAFLDRNLCVILEDLPTCAVASQIETDEDIFLCATVPSPDLLSHSPVAVKLLIDCSGSMQDENAISQAKKAAQSLICSLKEGDFASVSSFGSKAFHSFPTMLPINSEARDLLQDEIKLLSANLGGTELESALVETIRRVQTPENAPLSNILLITDGASWAHRRVIRAAVKAGQRIFCIGVGDSPAESLLYELALYTGGSYALLAQGDSLDRTITEMLGRMRQGGQIRANVQWGNKEISWLSLKTLSPIYSNEQVHVFGRVSRHVYEDLSELDQVRISFNNDEVSLDSFSLALEKESSSCSKAITKLAASKELVEGTESLSLDLAIRYQLISEQTSLVIVHERDLGNKALGIPESVEVSHMTSGRVARCISFPARVPEFRTGDESSLASYSAVHESPALWRQASRSDSSPRFSIDSFDDLEIPAFLRKSEHTESDQSFSSLRSISEPARKRSKFAPIEFMVRILHALTNRTRLDVPGKDPVPKESEQILEKIRGVEVRSNSQGVSLPKCVLERFSLISKAEISFEDALVELVAQVKFPSSFLASVLRIGNFPASVPLAILLLLINEKLPVTGQSLSAEAIDLLNVGIDQNVMPEDRSAMSKEVSVLITNLSSEEWPVISSAESVSA